jgi:hypothetical protein
MNSCKQKTGKQILCYKRRTGRIMLVSNGRRDEGEGRCVKFRERSESVALGLELADVESACDADGGSTADAVANLPFTTRVVLHLVGGLIADSRRAGHRRADLEVQLERESRLLLIGCLEAIP